MGRTYSATCNRVLASKLLLSRRQTPTCPANNSDRLKKRRLFIMSLSTFLFIYIYLISRDFSLILLNNKYGDFLNENYKNTTKTSEAPPTTTTPPRLETRTEGATTYLKSVYFKQNL